MNHPPKHCLISQSACGRELGNPVCPKCGMDERVVYPGQVDLEAAILRAERNYWEARAQELASKLAAYESNSTEPIADVTPHDLIVIKVPDIGDFDDVTVIELLVKPGDTVRFEQSLITVESDKASMEIPSSHIGVVDKLFVRLGDKVNEGTLVASLRPLMPMKAGQVFRDAPWAPEMVVLPSGSFIMGSPTDEADRRDDEGPQHQVTLAYKLAMGKYPVTFEEWDACLADGGTSYKPDDVGWGRGKRPVINVSWDDAQVYVAWLNKMLGIGTCDPSRYRLPSEAEWEYACRAGTKGMYSTPDGLMSDEWANYNASHTFEGAPKAGRKSDKTTPVGIYPANPGGLHDMHGNVWEWAQDGYEESYRGAPVDGSAWESGSSRRVLRGGSWIISPDFLRSANRVGVNPGLRNGYGFRLARTVP